MANNMSYFDLVGDDCMERIMEASADQLDKRIDAVIEKLMKYTETRYEEESMINTKKFSMCRFKLAIACTVLKKA
tara:strand:+ start:624 stop:848 length:225 start_codon:yes stop_codon:yes gene_type:complete